MTGIHDSLTIIDGLVISKWSRTVFVDMRKGGLTAANCTCSIWEGFADTMRNIAQWKRWFTDYADLITPVRTTADISRAKAEGKTGIILGFQNTSALEDQVGYVQLFKELGKIKAGMRHGVHCDPPAPLHTRTGERSLDVMRWGSGPRTMKVGFTNINAKAEGIEGKPTFREAFQRRRCLVPG